MENNVTTHEIMKVNYEPIELHSQTRYNRKSFIDRFKVTPKINVDQVNNIIEGDLIIDDFAQKLIFKQFDNDYTDLEFYRDSFRDKYSIDFSAIKQIVFLTKKSEYFLKSKEIPNKSFRSFVIFCYDFRVYSFNRRYKNKKNETIKFYQTLNKSIIDYRRNNNNNIDWTLINEAKLMVIYRENILDNINVQLSVTKTSVAFVPKSLCDRKKFRFSGQIPPQIVFHSIEDSFLIICSKTDSKYTIDECHKISKSIVGKDVFSHSIFYLYPEGNNEKTESICPNNRELMDSYEKLYSLCTPRNKAECKRVDKKWLSKLYESGWLVLVSQCLRGLSQIVKSLGQLKSFVYLMETPSPIWTWLFVSLTQICLQSSSRTIKGFSSLIKKNWIVSNGFQRADDTNNALFLLFLDSVYQLLRSSPLSFEFNEEMLICFYDLFVTSPNLTMISNDGVLDDIDWEKLYVKEVLDCFVNQYYVGEFDLKPLRIPFIDNWDFECFWTKMYTRWIPYMQVEAGGGSLRHFAMTLGLQLQHSVHSNYPFSLNYDKIVKYNEDSCHDDARSINTAISDD